MEEIWTRLKAWLKINAPQVLEQLQPGATDAQIRELEEFLNIQLPEDVKASYRICNGQVDWRFGLIDRWELLSIEHIKQEWETWKKLFDDGAFHDEDGHDYGSYTEPNSGICDRFWWNPKWIPLTSDGRGNYHCLDLEPAKEGRVGQIITMWHDDAERTIVAPSFKASLQQYVEGIESGKFIYSQKYESYSILFTDNT